MTNIYVSDLFGNNINSDTNFILLSSNELYKFIKQIAKNKNSSIWDIDRKKINEILKKYNIDPNNYITLGHIFYKNNFHKNNNEPKTILLVNKSITKYPTDFVEVSNYADGKIIKPIYNKNNDSKYVSLGLYFVNDKNNLKNDIGLIPEYLVSKYKTSKNSELTSNNFGLLSLSDQMLMLKKPNNQNNQQNDNEINFVDNGSYNGTPYDTPYSSPYNTHYNTQGELIFGIQNAEWNNSKMSNCLNNDNISMSDYNDLFIEQIYDSDNSIISDKDWNQYQGKSVVLVESETPWFGGNNIIDSDDSDDSVIDKKDDEKDDEQTINKENFNSNQINENSSNNCSFNNYLLSNDSYVVLILCSLIILLIVFRHFR